MTTVRKLVILTMVGLLATLLGCSNKPDEPSDLVVFSCDSMQGVQTPELVRLDNSVFAEGTGSLKVSTETPVTVPLFSVPYPKAQGAKLIFKALLKTENFGGDAYLQMQVHFPNGGVLTAQNYKGAARGTTDWMSTETSVSIRKGQKADSATLNLVVSGVGTVWIDDVHLIKAPEVAPE